MSFRFSAVVAAFVTGTFLLATPMATVQAQSGNVAPQAEQTPKPYKLTSEKLDAFVGAAIEVIRIRQAWKPKIQAAADQKSQRELSQASQMEMKLAVENAPGISLEEYVIIARASRDDPRLAQEIQRRVGSRIGGQQK